MDSAAAFIALLKQKSDFAITLIDVGCSGGIAPVWRVLAPRLRAWAFDPVTTEIERLRALESDPGVQHVAGFVGLPHGHAFRVRRGSQPDVARNPWHRLSVDRSNQLLSARETQSTAHLVVQSLWQGLDLADASQVIYLPEFFAKNAIDEVDFVKVDVDGKDLEVLVSLEDEFQSRRIIGLKVEVNFFGTDDPAVNTFHNVDRFLKGKGFELFDLRPLRYSTAALPARYAAPHPAQTIDHGRILQGDALYFRDLCSDEHAELARSLPADKLAKLAALYALFGLPDCAAEVLLKYGPRICDASACSTLLDSLVPEFAAVDGRKPDYRTFIERFERNDPLFYYRRPWPPSEDAEIERRNENIRHLRDELRKVYSSTSWRLTGPLRSVRRMLTSFFGDGSR